MVNRKTASALTIAAILACAIPTKSVASLFQAPITGQAVPSFPLPDLVAKGTQVSIVSSSDNMTAISKALGQGFEQQYSGKVNIKATDANAAIQEVLNGNADLAAISRPLTEAEKAKKLIAVPVRREKIAIVVGKDNPFAQSITGSQFAQIFRGEIKDWSAVGGPAGPIKVIDRPDASETRQALKPYPVFTTAEFKTGDTATRLSEDSTTALAQALGKEGIGYMLVSELEGQSEIKAIELHKTLPDDPQYPFSQPYSFVYAGGASPAVAAFLGYATGSPGQSVLNSAELSGYAVAPTADTGTTTNTAAGTTADGTTASSTATGDSANPTVSADRPGTAADGTTQSRGDENAVEGADGNAIIGEDGNVITDGAATDGNAGIARGASELSAGRGRWWWLLLPLAGLGLLIWAASKRSNDEEAGYTANKGSIGGIADDRIRSSYRGSNLPKTGLGDRIDAVATDGASTSVSSAIGSAGPSADNAGSVGLDKMAAGGAALAGGAVAAGTGLIGQRKDKAGDVTMDLGNISGSAKSSLDEVKGSTQSGLGNLRSNVQSGVQRSGDNIKGVTQSGLGNVQGSIDGARSNLQGTVQGSLSSSSSNTGLDSTGTKLRAGFDSNKDRLQSATEKSGSWLDRAKQRINEATDQVTDQASDIKDDITKG